MSSKRLAVNKLIFNYLLDIINPEHNKWSDYMPTIVCKNCGKEEFKKVKRDFCSKGCATSFRQKIHDPNIFERCSEQDIAYILGMTMGDGCLSTQDGKQERITIVLKDRDFMEELRQIISPDRKLYINKAKKETHSDSFAIITTNPDVIAKFKEYGLTERKSLTVKYPLLDCGTQEKHFIRGYFDANGSLFKNTVKGHEYWHISITTGSEQFAKKLMNSLRFYGIDATYHADSREGHNAWYVKVYKQEHVKAFGDFIYKGATLYLPRKHDLFQMI